jgi:CRP-like cAMP-binding protein
MMNVGSNVQQTILEYEAQLDVLRWNVEEKERNLQQIMTLHQAARTRQKELIADQGTLIELLRLVLEGDAEAMLQSEAIAGMQRAFAGPDANLAPAQDKLPQCKWFSSAPGVQPGDSFAQAAGLSGLSLPSYLSTAAARQNLRTSQTATSVLDQDLWEPARPGTIHLGQPPFQASSSSISPSSTLDTQAPGMIGSYLL